MGSPILPEGSHLPAAFRRHLGTDRWMEALPVAVYCCDPRGHILHFNSRAAALWGSSPGPGDGSERYCAAPAAEAMRTGEPVHERCAVVERPDGRRISVLVNAEPVFDEAGVLQGAVVCCSEAGRVSADELLRAEAPQFHTLLNALPAAVYITDAAGRITFYNEAAVALTGRRPVLGSDEWCVSWRLYGPDGALLPPDRCPMAMAIKRRHPILAAETVGERPDGSRFPCLAYPTPLFDGEGKLVGAINMLVDLTDQKQVESDREILIHELHHRIMNTLAIVQSIAAQTQRRTTNPADFVASFTGRLQAVARAHGSLYQNVGRGADFERLVREQVLLDGVENDRIAFSGPKVSLNAQQALHVALILHELGANARKHGALTVPEGKVAVSWSLRDGGRDLHFRWTESGGPPVKRLPARGFGSNLVEQTLKSHGGKAAIRYRRSGIVCTFALPLAGTASAGADAIAARQSNASPAASHRFQEA
jgi:two-component sensor histidine kinase